MDLPRLVSIGYEGRTVEDLVDELERHGVDVLVDVRLTPLSRKPGLSKRRLADHLRSRGIEYLHLRSLGNPRENREPFWVGLVADGCRVFEKLLAGPEPQAALRTVVELTETNVVALLCVERDHGRCHRQVVTREIAQMVEEFEPTILYA